ncbi:hypothetical protein M1I95_01210 [Rossellomorea marisflavi]|uniref:hypothetical protein n=1 Tax=Rossellomorea marisflavi TaxID=189381 RepID=UPI00279ADD66|nr:hypothetical protein [Rossellomorea marisflavi]UTE73196.1 hypothetical protein M1I95_01210 [Rossellomorea marisflavi]
MKEKLKVWGIPMTLVILIIGGMFLHQLLKMKEPPQKDWSRSVSLDQSFEDRPQLFNGSGDLFISSGGKIQGLTVKEGLRVEEKQALDVDVSGSNPYWTDGKKVIYYEDAKLLSHEGGKVSVLSEGVTGIETDTSSVYYWTGGTLYEMDPLTMDAGKIHSFKQEIDQVTIGKDGDALVQTKADDTHVQFHYIDREQRASAPFLLLEKNSSKQVENATYEIADGQLTLFYSETARSQGQLTTATYKVELPVDEVGDELQKAEKVRFVNADNGLDLESPGDIQLAEIDGEATLLLTAEGQEIGDFNAIALYKAVPNKDGSYQALRLNTTRHLTQSPLPLSDNEVVWFNYNGGTYELYGTSQNDEVINSSLHWTKASVKEALLNGTLMLFSSLVTGLTSFYWVLPSLFILILLNIFKPNVFEREGISMAEYVTILIFLIMPFTYTGKAMGDYYYQVAPDILSFSGSGYAVMIVISVLTALVWKFGRNEEWGPFAGVFYFMGTYILLYISLIGPYMFNLF